MSPTRSCHSTSSDVIPSRRCVIIPSVSVSRCCQLGPWQVTHKWHLGAMNITLDEPETTPVYFNNVNPYNNLKPMDDRPWCFRQAVITGAQVHLAAETHARIPCNVMLRPYQSSHHSECSLHGRQVYGFPDFVTALAFKRKAYAYVGLPAPPLQELRPANTPKMITILDRARIKPRHIHNIKAVLVRGPLDADGQSPPRRSPAP